jgi:hypothetical protein
VSNFGVEAANAQPGAKGKGEGKRKIHLTLGTPYQLDAEAELQFFYVN